MIGAFKKRLEDEGKVDVIIRVRPRAVRSELTGMLEDGSIKASVTAAAEDGQANIALAKLLAEAFNLPVSKIRILSGATARLKLVRITNS